jgi:hypothetical protein
MPNNIHTFHKQNKDLPKPKRIYGSFNCVTKSLSTNFKIHKKMMEDWTPWDSLAMKHKGFKV